MPAKRKAAPAAPPVQGYRRAPRYRVVTLELADQPEGAEPLTVTIQSNLSFEQLNAIPSGTGAIFKDIFAVIAPYITAWNLIQVNHETGEPEAVPPPAEAGPDVMLMLDPVEALWLTGEIRFGYLGSEEDRKKGNRRPPLRPGQRTSAPRHKAQRSRVGTDREPAGGAESLALLGSVHAAAVGLLAGRCGGMDPGCCRSEGLPRRCGRGEERAQEAAKGSGEDVSCSFITCPKCKHPLAVKHHSGRILVCDKVRVALVKAGVELTCTCSTKRLIDLRDRVRSPDRHRH